MNSLFAKLRAAVAGEPDAIPATHKTCAQWAKLWGIKPCRAGELLREGIAKGIVGKKMFRVRINDDRVMATPHYFEK